MQSRRVHQRHPFELELVIEHDGTEYPGTTRNISLGGMYVVTDADLKYGTEVLVRFRLPDLKEETTSPMTVRWREGDGLGLQFGSLRAMEVWGLNQLFRKHG